MIRHGLAPIAITLRPFGVLETPASARCVATLGFGHRPLTSSPRAVARAITLATVAGGADENFCATTSTITQIAADRIWHRRSTHHRRAIDKRARSVLGYKHTRDRHGGGHGIRLDCYVWTDAVPGSPRPFPCRFSEADIRFPRSAGQLPRRKVWNCPCPVDAVRTSFTRVTKSHACWC